MKIEKISEHKYKYISDGANFTIEGENFNPDVVKVTNNVPIEGGFKIGISGLNGNVIINGDTDFTVNLNEGKIVSLANDFDGACSIVSGDGTVSDYFVETAIQHKEVDLSTTENYATTELSNKLGVKTKVYYTNNDAGGVIDMSNETLNGEVLVAMGKASTIIGSAGNDNLIGRAADSYLVGGAGNDTFIVSGNAVITDLTDENVVYRANTWSKVGKNTFRFVGFDEADPVNVVDFTLSGKNLVDKNRDGVPDGVSIKITCVKDYGVGAAINGLSGEVSINDTPLGISRDDDYNLHFNPIVSPNISATQKSGAEALRFQKISSGSKISAQNAWIFLDGDGTYQFADGDYRVSTVPYVHDKVHLQNIKVSNGGKGLKLKVENGSFVPVEGLSLVDGANAYWGAGDMFEDTFAESFFNFDDFALLTQSAESIVPEGTFDDMMTAVVDFIDETFVTEEA